MTTQITSCLFEQAKFVRPYPSDVLEVPIQISGTSFFPGGHGIWNPDSDHPAFPIGGVMILGHDFHNAIGYTRAYSHWQENLRSPTWRNLLSVLEHAGIEESECFFTNFYMGLRQGKQVTGKFPGSKDAGFVSRCRLFLLHQIALQKPRLVLVLGNEVPKLISPLADKLRSWKKYDGFTKRDHENVSVIQDVQFHTLEPFHCNTVSLVHPCFQHATVASRHWTDSDGKSFTGKTAEIAMIRFAMTH